MNHHKILYCNAFLILNRTISYPVYQKSLLPKRYAHTADK